MSEKDVAAKLKDKARGILWKAISDKFGVGTPDRACKLRQSGVMFWAELKHIKQLPKRNCKVGLKHKQAAWLTEWQEDGGNCCLIVGVGSENKVAVFFGSYGRISREGVMREEFSLVGYSEVENLLKTRFKMV